MKVSGQSFQNNDPSTQTLKDFVSVTLFFALSTSTKKTNQWIVFICDILPVKLQLQFVILLCKLIVGNSEIIYLTRL